MNPLDKIEVESVQLEDFEAQKQRLQETLEFEALKHKLTVQRKKNEFELERMEK